MSSTRGRFHCGNHADLISFAGHGSACVNRADLSSVDGLQNPCGRHCGAYPCTQIDGVKLITSNHARLLNVDITGATVATAPPGRAQTEDHKARGNVFLRAENHAAALTEYGSGINRNPLKPALHSARGAARLHNRARVPPTPVGLQAGLGARTRLRRVHLGPQAGPPGATPHEWGLA